MIGLTDMATRMSRKPVATILPFVESSSDRVVVTSDFAEGSCRVVRSPRFDQTLDFATLAPEGWR